jgi:hypothetical protein
MPGELVEVVEVGEAVRGWLHDDLVAGQRPSPPVHRDVGEQAVLCVRSQALNSPICIRRSCWAVTSSAGPAALRPGSSSCETAADASRGMVEARSGFFRAGLDAVFRVLETGRDMLNSLRRGGALQRYQAPK